MPDTDVREQLPGERPVTPDEPPAPPPSAGRRSTPIIAGLLLVCLVAALGIARRRNRVPEPPDAHPALVTVGEPGAAPDPARNRAPGRGPAIPRGTLSREAIRNVVRAGQPVVRGCQTAYLKRHPTLDARLVLELTINPDGNVTEVTLDDSTGSDPQLDACMVSMAHELAFPPPEGDGFVFLSYPWVLRAK